MYLKKQQSEVVMSQAVMVVTSPVTNLRRECSNGKRFHMVNCYSVISRSSFYACYKATTKLQNRTTVSSN